jgi:GNAT superfamily N-acetyltransferase
MSVITTSVPPDLVTAVRAGDDTLVEIVDAVDGADERTVEALVGLHIEMFPEYDFVAEEIVADADARPERDSLIVHQWLVSCAGTPAGYVLFDTNVARRVALVHFLAIERPYRGLRVGGKRLATWLCTRVLETLGVELAERSPFAVPLGVVGESPDHLVRLWRGVGFRSIDVPYAEPVAGRSWRDRGDPSMRPMTLMWMPTPSADGPSRPLAAAGAAAFLIDHYELPIDHPTVVVTTGAERTRPGARR